MIIEALFLRADLADAGVPVDCPQFEADGTFACPTLASTMQIFADYWADRKARGLGYTRRHDCDDFARGAAQYFADAHALTPVDYAVPETDADTVACFELWYVRRDGTGHAINLVRTCDKGVVFMEPQTASQLALSIDELNSIRFRR